MAIVSANGAATPLSPNYIINGAFDFNQRGLSSTTATGYGFDRWLTFNSGGTTTTSTQTFPLGSCPVLDFDGNNYIRTAVTGQSNTGHYAAVYQRVENVATGSGQTVTLSFYARAASGTPTIAPTLEQSFGTGGSASLQIKGTPITISTSWARYTATFTLPSLSGKTVGAGNYLTVWLFTSAGSGLPAYVTTAMLQNNTFDIWGVQLEAGSIATPFRRNSPNLQAEQATCQRYFWSPTIEANPYMAIATCYGITTTTGFAIFEFPVPMRIKPTLSVDSVSNFQLGFTNTNYALTSLTQNMDGTSTRRSIASYVPTSSLASATQISMLYRNAGAGLTGSIGFSAEL
jgi:hypothetical protein